MNHWKTTVKRIASSLAQTVVVLVGITLITF